MTTIPAPTAGRLSRALSRRSNRSESERVAAIIADSFTGPGRFDSQAPGFLAAAEAALHDEGSPALVLWPFNETGRLAFILTVGFHNDFGYALRLWGQPSGVNNVQTNFHRAALAVIADRNARYGTRR